MHDLKFTTRDCDDVVRHYLHLDAQTVDFEVIPRHQDNYIFKITIQRDSNEETLYFYAKSNSSTPKIDQILTEIQSSVPEFSSNFTPKFVCGKSELLFFEDLTCHKFQTHPDLFTLKHVHRTLTVLAQLHAAGFAYEAKGCKLDDKYFEDARFDVAQAEDLLWSLLDDKENVPERVKNLEQRLQTSKFRKTVCHCNLTAPNVMFQYENGVPTGCKLINFKPKLAPPVYDVLQAIFFNTTGNLRQDNFETLLLHYHECLRNELQRYNLDVVEVLSVEELQLACHDLLPLVKLEAAVFGNKSVRKYDQALYKKTCEELKEILTSNRVTREDCYVIVRNNVGTTEYDLLSFSTSDSLKLKIQINHSLEEKTINCFVKTKSDQARGCFNKEVFVYETLVPKLQHCGIDTINECVLPCYFQRADDILVFEDLSLQNYQSLPAHHNLNYTLLTMLVKKLARFHASVLVFEETNDHSKYLNGTSPSDGFKASLKSISDVVLLFPDIEGTISAENLPKLVERFNSVGKTSDRFRNVLCHGNLTTSNVFIQFDDDRPHDCRFVNFDNIRYCPPAFDFLSALYLTTDRANRIKYEEELKRLYYDELGRTVSSYNYSVGKFFSYQEFLDSVEDARPGIVVQALLYSMVEVSSGLISDEACKQLEKVCQNSAVFKERLRENVLDLYAQCSCLA